MKKALFAALLSLLTASAHSQLSPLSPVSQTPSGQLRDNCGDGRCAVSITFNQPVVPLAKAQDLGDKCPLAIAPATPGSCRWNGTQTLTFIPAEAWKPSTRYDITLKAGLKAQGNGAVLAKDAAWYFITQRPAVLTSRPVDNDSWVTLDPTLFMVFTQPMDMDALRGAVTFRGMEDAMHWMKLPAGVRFATDEEIDALFKNRWGEYDYSIGGKKPLEGTVVAVKPGLKLRPESRYRLEVKETALPRNGKLGMEKPVSISFSTYRHFDTVALAPNTKCLPTRYNIAFTNPVRYADLVAALRVNAGTEVKPDRYADQEFIGEDATELDRKYKTFRLPEIGFRPNQTYTFTVLGTLKDIFGNELGGDRQFTVETAGVCPALRMATGFGVFESYLPARHPVSVIGIETLPLRKTQVQHEDVIPLYKSLTENQNAGEEGTAAPQTSDWLLPDKGEEKEWKVADSPNSALKTFVDMKSALGAAQGGFSLAQIRYDNRRYAALDNITATGATLKVSPNSTLIWATALKTGKPVKRAAVELRSDDNKVVWRGFTNGDGFVLAPGWTELGIESDRRSQPYLWAFVADPSGTAVVSSRFSSGIEPWRFNIYSDWGPYYNRYNTTLFTDRGIYRPGEKVYGKAVIRELIKGDWELTQSLSTAYILVRDSRGQEVLRSTAAISPEFGSVDFEFQSTLSSPPGSYSVTLTDKPVERKQGEGEEGDFGPNQSDYSLFASASFRVEAFKAAQFEVKLLNLKEEYLPGEERKPVISARYLHGAPMAGEKAQWTVRVRPGYFTPKGIEGYVWSDGRNNRYGDAGTVADSGEGVMDAKGEIAVPLSTAAPEFPGPAAVMIEASALSADMQRIFARRTATVHGSDIYVGIQEPPSMLEAGKPFKTSFVTVRPDGSPVPDTQVSVKITRETWLSAQRAGIAGRLEWVSEKKVVDVATFTFTSGKKPYEWEFTPDSGGQYTVAAECADEQGRKAAASASMFVAGTGEAWWERKDNDIVELVADKKSYKPGDTARIMVKSPFPKTTALVTVEREGVLYTDVDELTGGADYIKIPIKESFAPNVYVSVTLSFGRSAEAKFSEDGEEDLGRPKVKFGYIALQVDPGGRKLEVKLKTDKKDYRPRGEVEAELEVRNEDGRGIAAEVTLFAVDEGVLALTGYQTPDIFSEFYATRGLQFVTADSRLFVIGQRNFGEKGENRGGGGSSLLSMEGADMRSRFIPTAYWNPSVRTDAKGRAKVKFTLPDNLSRFRLMAVASSTKLFGAGETTLKVTKPLMLRPSLPRFARTGDTFTGGVVVSNYTGESSTITVSAELYGQALTLAGDTTRQIFVENGRTGEVLWNMSGAKPGDAVLRFRARGGDETDGLEWILATVERARPQYTATAGAVKGETTETLAFPDGAISAETDITLSPSALSRLDGGIRYLLDYPYGCLEQKLSRALPVILAGDLVSAFGLGDIKELKASAQEVLDRMGEYQDQTGGLHYWTNPNATEAADTYLTAYALEAAWLAKQRGYRTQDGVTARAAEWLHRRLESGTQDYGYPYSVNEQLSSQAYAVYVLALYKQPLNGRFQKLYERLPQMPFHALAHMLKAAPLLSADKGVTKNLSQSLLSKAVSTPTKMHFEEREAMPWLHSSAAETTALCLDALLSSGAGFAGDFKAVQWLVDEQKVGRWRTTSENVAVLRALSGYFNIYEKENPSFTATVTADDGTGKKEILKGDFADRKPAAITARLPLAARGGAAAAARLAISSPQARAYYTLRTRYIPVQEGEAEANGFTIERKMEPLRPADSAMTRSTRWLVKIKVTTPQDRTFVALEDRLPAGFELVDTTLSTESTEDAAVKEGTEAAEWFGGFYRTENYDDKVQAFADYMTAGTHEFTYMMQAVAAGDFSWPGARCEMMYEPEVYAETRSGSITVK